MEALKLQPQPTNESPLKAIIRRATLLIVEEKSPDGWWYIVCNDFEGWVKIIPEVSYMQYHKTLIDF